MRFIGGINMLVSVSLLSACTARQMTPDDPWEHSGDEAPAEPGKAPEGREKRPSRDTPKAAPPAEARQSAAVGFLVRQARLGIEQEDWPLAQSHLERAFRMANRDPWVSYYMGIVLLAQNFEDQAEQWAFQAVSYFEAANWQGKSEAWELIAACRRQRGDLRGANEAQAQADLIRANES